MIFLPGFGQQSRDIAERYTALDAQLTAIGRPVATLGPVISDFPIWFAEGERAPALALPDEPPTSIIALARTFPGTHYLIMTSDPHGQWPAVLQTSVADANCFKPVPLGTPADPVAAKALKNILMYELVCP